MLCLVTDRTRADVVEQAKRAVDAGIDVIQIRERDLEAAPLLELVGRVTAVAVGSNTRVVVNDRVDVALAARADGIHLRGDSISTADARRLCPPPALVGRSVHSADEARAAGEVDYLVAGTVYPTPSKPDAARWLGLDGLRTVVSASARPVIAIGGISVNQFPAIAAAGAAGVAGIGLFAHGPLAAIVQAARSAFDTARARP